MPDSSGSMVRTKCPCVSFPNAKVDMVFSRFFGVCWWWQTQSQKGLLLSSQGSWDIYVFVARITVSFKGSQLAFHKSDWFSMVLDFRGFTISSWVPELPWRHFCLWMDAKSLLLRGEYVQETSHCHFVDVTSLPTSWFWASDFHNSNRINFSCLNPTFLGYFVIVVPGI